MRENSVEQLILQRQLAIKDLEDKSWTTRVRQLLWEYKLPSAFEILENPPQKKHWARTVKDAVSTSVFDELKEEAKQKKSLKFINLDACQPGHPHPVWDTPPDPKQVIMASVKAKLLTQRYPLTATSCAGKSKVNSCPLCSGPPECLTHFLTECPSLSEIRTHYLTKLDTILDPFDYSVPDDKPDLVQFLLDVSNYDLPPDVLYSIEAITRKMCHALHNERSIKLSVG